MSTPKIDAKRAELYELFERLSSRRIRPIKPEDATKDATTSPKTTVDPSLKRLSTINKETNVTGRRPRRNTVAVASITKENSTGNDMHPCEAVQSEAGSKDAESLAKFSLANEKKYPFTFKHMLHKLYNKDDWARAIKEMLEKSKNEFKPLAELEKTVTKEEVEEEKAEKQAAEKEGKDSGVVRFKVVLPNGTSGGKRNSIGGRQRSHSVVGVGRTPSAPLSPTLRSPSTSAAVTQPEANRALKKRCVGRRKSMSGALNGADPVAGLRPRGNWVYDAAISSSEPPPPSKLMAFPHASPPSPNITGGTGFESKNAVSTKRRVGMVVRKRSVSASFAMVPNKVPIMMPLQQVTNFNTNGLVARRRRLGERVDKEENEETNKKPAKRPFAA